MNNLYSKLQQVLEIDVLLVCHVVQTILSMDLSTSLVEMTAHRVILRVPGKTSRLTIIALLLLHPNDGENLCDNDTPKDTPDYQNALESVDLKSVWLATSLKHILRQRQEIRTYCGANFESKMYGVMMLPTELPALKDV
jgi:hypothetical protein